MASEAAPAPARGIPLESMPRRVQSDAAFLRRAVADAEGSRRWSRLEESLERIEGDFIAVSTRSRSDGMAPLPLSSLLSLDRQWRFVGQQIDRVSSALEGELAPLTLDIETIRSLRRDWAAVRESGALDRQAALEARVRELVEEAGRTERRMARPLDHGIALAQRAASLRTDVERGRRAVGRELARRDRGLGRIDSAPIWRADAWRVGDQSTADSGNVELDFLRSYEATSHPARDAVLLIALLFLPFLLIAARRLRKEAKTRPDLAAFRATLMRPWSAWSLLALVALAMAQLDGPPLRIRVLLLLALVPVMRLQPPEVRTLFGRWFYLAGVLYLAHIAAQFLAADALAFRLLVGATSLLVGVGLGWWWWRHRMVANPARGVLAAALRTLAGLFALLAFVALAANIVGNVTLAGVLTDGIVEGIYIGLLVFAAGHVFDALWALAMARGLEALGARARHTSELFSTLSHLARLMLAAVWAVATLAAFRLLGPIDRLLDTVGGWAISVGSASISLKGVAVFGLTVAVSFWLAGTLRRVLADDILPAIQLPRGVGNSIATLSYYMLLLAGLGFALSAAGFELSQLTLVLGALGVGIGLGLQDVVRNFVSGLILMVERPIQPGDIIDLDGILGKVRAIGMRATTMSTYEGAEVVVPNGLLIANKMTNWTLSSERRRVDVPVGVAYGSDPREVAALLLKTVSEVPGVQSNPAPTVLFDGFGDNALLFIVRGWTARADDAITLRSDLGLAVHDALQAAGIRIPFPQRDLHLRSWPEGAASPSPGLGA